MPHPVFEPRAVTLDLLTEVGHQADGVLNRIALRKAVRLGEQLAFAVEQHSLGGRRSAIDTQERFTVPVKRGVSNSGGV